MTDKQVTTPDKYVLIIVAGSTPQILTETLYDFCVQRGLSIARIVIITTEHGEQVFEKNLFGNGQGMFYQFCRSYNIKAHSMAISVRVIRDEQGRLLRDIRTEDENRAAANFITDIVREFTSDPQTALLASIAGGRKTMSTYLGYAMQLYARRQDKLFHVLISPDKLESNPAFYFPDAGGKDIVIADGTGREMRIAPGEISITNAEIPFVRLREYLSFVNGPYDLTYEDLVKLTQQEINFAFTIHLNLDTDNFTLKVNWRNTNLNIKLKPMDFAFYWYLLEKKRLVNSNDADIANTLRKIYQAIKPGSAYNPEFGRRDLTDMRSRINRTLRRSIPYEPILQNLIILSNQDKRIPTYTIRFAGRAAIDGATGFPG